MLKNIKSIIIIKKVFSRLRIKKKLDLIKYNNIIKNRLDINLLDYKTFSGRYIVYEKEGRGKEFSLFTNNLIFEGEYLKGKKNGQGKEYYNFEKKIHKKYLKFEGNYLNGKKNGKGIKYYINGEIKFKGEYMNGKKWTGEGFDEYLYKEYYYEIKDGKGFVKKYNRSNQIKYLV